LIYASIQIIRWILRMKNFELNLGLICLSLEWTTNVLRVLQSIFNPVYNVYEIRGVEVLLTLPLCFSVISSILIIAFWLDLTTDQFYHGKFLGVMKIPALVFIFICLAIEIIFDFIKTLTIAPVANAVYYFFVSLHVIIIIFSFIAAWRILKKLKIKSRGSKKMRITLRIITSGMITLIGFILILCQLIPPTPVSWVVLWIALFLMFSLQSAVLINIFEGPKKNQKSTTKHTTSSDNVVVSAENMMGTNENVASSVENSPH